jgi:hypothetical protein
MMGMRHSSRFGTAAAQIRTVQGLVSPPDLQLSKLSAATDATQVLSTIHQPRSSIFAMFDLLLLIAEGKLLYFGPAALAVGTLIKHPATSSLCILLLRSSVWS